MSVRPILFSTPMVRALLAGTKTQTRRALKPQPGGGVDGIYHRPDGRWIWLACGGDQRESNTACGPGVGVSEPFRLRHVVGDLLWVREAWAVSTVYDGMPPRDINPGGKPNWCGIYYPATKAGLGLRNRAGIHMPRWASRLTLEVIDVRVERLQDISPEDARDEGVNRRSPKVRQMWLFGAGAEERERIYLEACPWEFEDVWETINGPGSWNANPWVAAYTFTVHRQNVDALLAKHGAAA